MALFPQNQSILVFTQEDDTITTILNELPKNINIYICSSINEALNHLNLEPDLILLNIPCETQYNFLIDFKDRKSQRLKEDKLFNPSNTISVYSTEEEKYKLLDKGARDFILQNELKNTKLTKKIIERSLGQVKEMRRLNMIAENYMYGMGIRPSFGDHTMSVVAILAEAQTKVTEVVSGLEKSKASKEKDEKINKHIKELHSSGLQRNEIAREIKNMFNIHRTTVYRRMKKLGYNFNK